MAKQAGEIILVGTIDDLTFYIMDGKGYARKKSSLTGKRVKKDKRFKRTMQSAHRLARGSQLASKVYRSLPRAEQVYALLKELKHIAVLALKEGVREAEVLVLLERKVKPAKPATFCRIKTSKLPVAIPSPLFTKPLFRIRSRRDSRILKRAGGNQEVLIE